jgi:DNA replication and repair protein RecF
MKISSLILNEFRGFKALKLSFGPDINIICGANGSGKTSILESISLLTGLHSFRTNHEEELIRTDSDFAVIEGKIKTNLLHDVKISILKKGRQIMLDNKLVKKFSDYLGTFIAIVYTPEDTFFFNEAPKVRRKFIDSSLSNMYQDYLQDLVNYQSLIKAKSNLLKLDTFDSVYCDVLHLQLAKLTQGLLKHRYTFCSKLEFFLNRHFANFQTKHSSLQIVYESDFNLKMDINEIKAKLDQNLSKELLKRTILTGIQYDDFSLLTNNINIATYFSQGEKKIASLCLKLALVELIQQEKQVDPVLLLDDILSELDSIKKTILFDEISQLDQVVVTTTSLIEIPQQSINNMHIINL